jgi:hypothetical protein
MCAVQEVHRIMHNGDVRFEALKTMNMKTMVFWNLMSGWPF